MKRTLFHLVLLFCISVCYTSFAQFSGGNGYPSNPYRIRYVKDMIALSDSVKKGQTYQYYYFIMENDISFYINGIDSSQYFTPIGGWSSNSVNDSTKKFKGIFDGDNYKIYNLSLYKPNHQYISIFGISYGEIRNLGVENITLRGVERVAGLVSDNGGIIENCYSKASVTCVSSYVSTVGGLVCNNLQTGIVRNSYSNSIVTNSSSQYCYAGGLIAANMGLVDNCYSIGSVTTTNDAYGVVNNRSSGGITGYNLGNIYNSYSTVNINSTNNKGVLVGFQNAGSIMNCYYLQTSGVNGVGSGSSTGTYSKTNLQLKDTSMISTFGSIGSSLNYNQTIIAWKNDFANNINGGYPILLWQYPDLNVVTNNPTNIFVGYATIKGSINIVNDSVVEKGFLFKQNDSLNWNKIIINSDSLFYRLSNLDTNTTYSYKAYATTIYNTYYGGLKSFKTLQFNPIYTTPISATICQGQKYTLNGFNDSTAGLHTLNLQTINGCDSIVNLNLTVNPIKTTNLNASICQGQTYSLNGFSSDTAGFFTRVLQTYKGCDSIVNLNLTVNPNKVTNLTAIICQGQSYTQNGFNVSTAGLHTRNLQTTKGCDSIVNLTLSVNPKPTTIIQDTICQGETYTENGFNVSTSGLHIRNLQTYLGCDSIVRLTLVINLKKTTNLNASICQGQTYTLNGFNADSTGVYTLNLQTTKGCDSTVNLNLTVNPNINTMIYDTICQGQTYTLYGFNEDSTGVYIRNLNTIKGCDSIVTLNLTVNPIYNTVLFDTICQGETYTQNGFNASSTGIYTRNLQSIQGCDSVVTLNLIVNPTPTIPNDLSIQIRTNYLEITWISNGNNYELYRNDTLITTTNQPIYLDHNVINSHAYCYKVKSIIGNCESEFCNVVCKSFVGLDNEIETKVSTKIYPNPTNNKAVLEVVGLKSKAAVRVMDLFGRVIKEYKINKQDSNIEIDVRDFAKGVYNVVLQNDKMKITNKLIVR